MGARNANSGPHVGTSRAVQWASSHPDQGARFKAREMDFLRVLRCRRLRVGTGDRLKIAEAGSFLTGKKEIGT